MFGVNPSESTSICYDIELDLGYFKMEDNDSSFFLPDALNGLGFQFKDHTSEKEAKEEDKKIEKEEEDKKEEEEEEEEKEERENEEKIEKEVDEEDKETEDKEEAKIKDSFPFTNGIGLYNILEEIGFKFTKKYSEKYKSEQISFKTLFKTTIYEEGHKKKKNTERMEKADKIRVKIKRDFHRELKNITNEGLKKGGVKKNEYLFDSFPQCFIRDDTHNMNNKYLDFTYEKLIETDFLSDYEKKIEEKEIKKAKEKFKINKNVLTYLKQNHEITKKSGFDKIKNMKYSDLLKAYFQSSEFEKSIKDMCINPKGQHLQRNLNYIEKYINEAFSYVNFYSINKKHEKNINIE